MRVPVVDLAGKQLMPCQPSKARKLMRDHQAIGKYNKLGLFYIQLQYEVLQPNNQRLAIGIDPGSSFEGYSVVGEKDTVLNMMGEATDGKAIQKKLEVRRHKRRARRFRKWRRPMRANRLVHKERIPPSTRAIRELKFRVLTHLCVLLPITDIAVEDVKAATFQRAKKYNKAFSPVQAGKTLMYKLIEGLGLRLWKFEGHETAEAREEFRLKKSSNKATPAFESHAVDAWTLAALITGAEQPTTKALYYFKQIKLHRRQLHAFQPSKGGIRRPYGGTRSLGLKEDHVIFHPKWGFCSVGGHTKGRLSLHDYWSNKRFCQNAKVEDCSILT